MDIITPDNFKFKNSLKFETKLIFEIFFISFDFQYSYHNNIYFLFLTDTEY